MILDVPFFRNAGDGSECMQVGMQTVIKYFLNKDISLNELSLLTQRKPHKWTNSVQLVPALVDMGLDVIFYSKEDIALFLEGEETFRKQFGADWDVIKSHYDVPVIVKSTKNLLEKNIFEKKLISIDEIESHLAKGHIPMVIVDNNVLYEVYGKPYYGHFIVLIGYDDEYIYYHESGPINPTPCRKVLKSQLVKAMNTNGTDNDCIIVKGVYKSE